MCSWECKKPTVSACWTHMTAMLLVVCAKYHSMNEMQLASNIKVGPAKAFSEMFFVMERGDIEVEERWKQ